MSPPNCTNLHYYAAIAVMLLLTLSSLKVVADHFFRYALSVHESTNPVSLDNPVCLHATHSPSLCTRHIIIVVCRFIRHFLSFTRGVKLKTISFKIQL